MTQYAGCLYVECRHAECRYVECRHGECRYVECRHGECRGAAQKTTSTENFPTQKGQILALSNLSENILSERQRSYLGSG